MKKLTFALVMFLVFTNFVFAQSKISIQTGVDYASPMGDFGDLYSSGFGGHLNIAYQLTDSWDLGANVGYKLWNADNDYYSQKFSELSGENVNVEVDMPFSIIPIMIDGYYYFSRSEFQPYLNLSFGVHLIKINSNSYTLNGEEHILNTSESKTEKAYKLGAGFNYLLSEKIGINFSATIDGNSMEISQDESSTDGSTTISNSSSSTASFINVGLGVTFKL